MIKGHTVSQALWFLKIDCSHFQEPQFTCFSVYHEPGTACGSAGVYSPRRLLSWPRGQAFGSGGEGWLRLCFSMAERRLHEAIDRLSEFVASGSYDY